MIAVFTDLYVIVRLVVILKLISHIQHNRILELHRIAITSTRHRYKIVSCSKFETISCTAKASEFIAFCGQIVHIKLNGSRIICLITRRST